MNGGATLGFLYQITATSGNGAVTGLNTNGYGLGEVAVGYSGNPSALVGIRSMASPGSLAFLFDIGKGQTVDLFVTTTATETSNSTSAILGNNPSLNVQTFAPAPEPASLTLALLGLPAVGLMGFRRFRARLAGAGAQ
jgi:hypothetical protein